MHGLWANLGPIAPKVDVKGRVDKLQTPRNMGIRKDNKGYKKVAASS